MPSDAPALFDSVFLKRLERLSLEVRRSIRGGSHGARRARDSGTGVSFRDHRSYGHGDELRHVDWHLYGRLEKLFVKLYETEQENTLHLAVDMSASMGFGEPSKLSFAARLAGALGYVALADEDRVTLTGFSSELGQRFGPVRGKRQCHGLFRALEGIEAAGRTDLAGTLTRLAATGRPGLAVVLSDWLVDGGWEDGLRALRGARFEVFVVQVLAREELEPTLGGEISLVDAESGETIGLTVNDAVRARYEKALAAHCGAIERFCHDRGIGYLRTSSDASFEELVLTTLRRTPLLQ